MEVYLRQQPKSVELRVMEEEEIDEKVDEKAEEELEEEMEGECCYQSVQV